MNEVEENIARKLKSSYLEIVKPQESISIEDLKKYVEYVKTSPEVIARMEESMHEFDGDKLYFVFY